jgi:hypothetical protein
MDLAPVRPGVKESSHQVVAEAGRKKGTARWLDEQLSVIRLGAKTWFAFETKSLRRPGRVLAA